MQLLCGADKFNNFKFTVYISCPTLLCLEKIVFFLRWYMAVSKDEAVKILMSKQGSSFQHKDGAFILRPSETNPGEMSLSVR